MTNNKTLLLFIKKDKKFLLFLFIVSFLVRVIFFGLFLSHDKNYFRSDSLRYSETANQIFNGNGIKRVDGSYNFWRVPGYSIFLAFCYKLFDGDHIKSLLVQIFLSSFIPLLIFLLSLVLFKFDILLAKISSIFSAFLLGYILYSGLMMTESLFCIFFYIFIILFLLNFNFFFCKTSFTRNSFINIFLAGIFLGISSLLRPMGHYFMPLFILMLLLNKNYFIQNLKRSGLFFFGWLIIVFWWLLRNYLLTGFIFFHTLPGHHLLYYAAVPIDVAIKKISPIQSSDRILINERKELYRCKEEKIGRKLIDIEKCCIDEKLAFNYIKRGPFLFFKNSIYNMIKTCLSLHSSTILAILGHSPPSYYKIGRTFWDLIKRFLFPPVKNIFIRGIIFSEIFLLFFILLGFLFCLIKSFFDINLFCIIFKFLPVILFMIILTFATGFARLRLPIEPFLIIPAFYFWLSFFKRIS
ncbi:hypothetical protein KAT08_01790 [Candidatus Babeliales bacterium]|nr:hypothetical protein [Candidatus Babeliales bacterium]